MLQILRRKLAPVYENMFSFWPGGWSPFPSNVVFELLYACNLACPFCYLRVEEKVKKIKAQRHLLTGEILRTIDQIPSQTGISFTGGEIMLRKDIIEVLAHAKKRHRVGIISNLTMNTPEKNQSLVAMGLDTLMFSLDGYTPALHDKVRGKGSWGKTIATVKAIQEQKKRQNKVYPTFTINSVVLPHNYTKMSKMVELAAKFKVNWLNFQLLDPSVDRSGYELHDDLTHLKTDYRKLMPKLPRQALKSNLDKSLKLAKKFNLRVTFSPKLEVHDVLDYYGGKIDLSRGYCTKIFHLSRISPFGDVYPCFNLKIGSVLDQPFMKLWNNYTYRHFRQQIKRGAFKAACVGCCHLRLVPKN